MGAMFGPTSDLGPSRRAGCRDSTFRTVNGHVLSAPPNVHVNRTDLHLRRPEIAVFGQIVRVRGPGSRPENSLGNGITGPCRRETCRYSSIPISRALRLPFRAEVTGPARPMLTISTRRYRSSSLRGARNGEVLSQTDLDQSELGDVRRHERGASPRVHATWHQASSGDSTRREVGAGRRNACATSSPNCWSGAES